MIQPNEIRIGNIVECVDPLCPMSICKIDKIDTFEEEIGLYNKDNRYYDAWLDGIKPIPLTEDVLLKCGFGYEGAVSSFTHPLMDMWLSLDCDSEEFIMYPTNEQRKERQERLMNKFRNGEGLIPTAEAEYKMSDIRIIYLHQLQNLYFALTNQELEIEL